MAAFWRPFAWIDGEAFAARPPVRGAVDGRRRCRLKTLGEDGVDVTWFPEGSMGEEMKPADVVGGCVVWKG